MSWKDLGVIFAVNNLESWIYSHCYVPTAIQLRDRIRVFCSFWDNLMYGRLGYIDVDLQDPTYILGYSKFPLLKDSSNSSFDCDGVTPLSIINHDNVLRLYYAGWRRYNDINKRYTLYTGLAISRDNGKSFERLKTDPILGPRHKDELLRTGGFVINIKGEWRTWLATSNQNEIINNKIIPTYNLETTVSKNGIDWPNEQIQVFTHRPGKILGYGRSAIWLDNENIFHGLFSVRDWDGKYRAIQYSTSHNETHWDDLTSGEMAFTINHTHDQQTEVCFPALIHQKDRILMFYNGNNFGQDGLRLAIWNL